MGKKQKRRIARLAREVLRARAAEFVARLELPKAVKEREAAVKLLANARKAVGVGSSVIRPYHREMPKAIAISVEVQISAMEFHRHLSDDQITELVWQEIAEKVPDLIQAIRAGHA